MAQTRSGGGFLQGGMGQIGETREAPWRRRGELRSDLAFPESWGNAKV